MKNNNGMWLATGLLIGNLVGMGLLYIYERWEESTSPADVVCQKGIRTGKLWFRGVSKN